MKQALWLIAATCVALLGVCGLSGYAAAYGIAFGAITVMSALISGTFLWLWWERTTPLALGMATSWAGTASVMGWWWLRSLADGAENATGSEVLLVFLSLQISGAILHFDVMQTSMGYSRRVLAVPLALSVAAGAAAAYITNS